MIPSYQRVGHWILGSLRALPFSSALSATNHPLMRLASRHRVDFVVSTVTKYKRLVIGVSARRSVLAADVDRFMTLVATAVAFVERIDRHVMEKWLFEHRRVVKCESSLGVLMRRRYDDPSYPQRVVNELRRILAANAMQSVLIF